MVLKRIAELWSKHALTRHSASLAFFSLLTLAPMLVVLAGIGGYFLGSERVAEQVIRAVEQGLGEGASELVRGIIEQTVLRGSGATATLIGILLAFWGASGLLQHLKASLDTLWEAPPHAESGILHWLIARLIAGAGVILLVLLLSLSLILEVVLMRMETHLKPHFSTWTVWLRALQWGLPPVLVWFGSALLYWWLPATRPKFRYALIGALVATFILVLLRRLIWLYLATTGLATLYGSAGSVVVLLLGVYFSAQAFFLGAVVCVLLSRPPQNAA